MKAKAPVLYATHGHEEGVRQSDYRVLPVKLQQAREALMMNFRPIFQASDLSDAQWRVLRVLCSVEQIDTSALAKRALLLGPSLSRILKDLEQRGLIVKKASPQDSRRSFHRVASAGRKLVAATSPKLDPVFVKLAAGLSAGEVKQLNRLLDSVVSTLGEA
jgi:homoprotocatechuate degradation regulator HpaR